VPQISFQTPPLTPTIRKYLYAIGATYLLSVAVYLISGFNDAFFARFYLGPLALRAADVWSGWVWQVVTYIAVYPYGAILDAAFSALMLYFFGSMLVGTGKRDMLHRAVIAGALAAPIAHVVVMLAVSQAWSTLSIRPLYGARFAVDAVVAAACWTMRSQRLSFFGVPTTGKGILLFFIALDVLMSIIGDATNLVGSLAAIGAGVLVVRYDRWLKNKWTLFRQRRKLRVIEGKKGKSTSVDESRKWMN
jgi:hypothetical protein